MTVPTAPAHASELLTVGEAMQELRCSESTVRRLMGRGELAAVKIGSARAIRVRRASLDALLVRRAGGRVKRGSGGVVAGALSSSRVGARPFAAALPHSLPRSPWPFVARRFGVSRRGLRCLGSRIHGLCAIAQHYGDAPLARDIEGYYAHGAGGVPARPPALRTPGRVHR